MPVSMAGRTQALAGICKVAPVYTPPQQRAHGYGTAVTAAATRHAVDTGAREVLLFTDATNPVTNSIYHRLGYRPAEDRLVLTFYLTLRQVRQASPLAPVGGDPGKCRAPAGQA